MSEDGSVMPCEQTLFPGPVRTDQGGAQCGPPTLQHDSAGDLIATTHPPGFSHAPVGPPFDLNFFGGNPESTGATAMNQTMPPPAMCPPPTAHYLYDPRLFDVGMQFSSHGPPTGASHSMGPQAEGMMWHDGAATAPDSMAMVSPMASPMPPQGQMPMVPGISNFEPMLSSYDTNDTRYAQNTATSPSHGSGSISGSISGSSTTPPSSSDAVGSSRKGSLMYPHVPQPPDNFVVKPTQLDVRFEPAQAPVSGSRKKLGVVDDVSEQVPDKKRRLLALQTDRGGATTAGPRDPHSEKPAPSPKASTAVAAGGDSPKTPGGTASPENPAAAGGSRGAVSQRVRNRVAATKCRAKSKAAVAELEATERAVSSQHAELEAAATHLRQEVLALKNEVLLHGNCDCEHIQQYLANAAQAIAGSMMATGSSRTPTPRRESGLSTTASSPHAPQHDRMCGGPEGNFDS